MDDAIYSTNQIDRIEIDESDGTFTIRTGQQLALRFRSMPWSAEIAEIIKASALLQLCRPGAARWSRTPKALRAQMLRAGIIMPYREDCGILTAEIGDYRADLENLEESGPILDAETAARLDTTRAQMLRALRYTRVHGKPAKVGPTLVAPAPALIPDQAGACTGPARRRRGRPASEMPKSERDRKNREARKAAGLDQWNGVVNDADREIFRLLAAASRSGNAVALAMVRQALGSEKHQTQDLGSLPPELSK